MVNLSSDGMILYDFKKEQNVRDWQVVDDVVMGGRSSGEFLLNEEGQGVFEGEVSLENNGGFSSVRYRMDRRPVLGFDKVMIRLKGDGKRYQFRIKSDISDRHSYIAYFQTSGSWETIEIPLKEMYPTYRGMKLSMPNFPGRHIEEIAILISNKRAERFRLEIDKIILQAEVD